VCNATLLRRLKVDGAHPRAGDDDQLEVRQALDESGRQWHALAH
jgi:hypothetical protein